MTRIPRAPSRITFTVACPKGRKSGILPAKSRSASPLFTTAGLVGSTWLAIRSRSIHVYLAVVVQHFVFVMVAAVVGGLIVWEIGLALAMIYAILINMGFTLYYSLKIDKEEG